MRPDSEFYNFPSEDELMNIIMITSSAIWGNELLKPDIEKWLSNFKGEVFEAEQERLLALWLLSHFTFYNYTEVAHLCKVLYRDLIHMIVNNSNGSVIEPSQLIDEFFQKTNIIPLEQISGSSGFIAYFFRHQNELPMTLFNFSINNVSDTFENIIIIDDVTLSEEGSQMDRFLKKYIKKYPTKRFYLITLIATDSAIDYLTRTHKIQIVSAIRLDSRDQCFHQESNVFSQVHNLIEEGRKFAEHYGKKIGIKGVHPLGYQNGQYTFGFFYNTPDNTLPIFWGQVNGWIPIIKRYHKNYKDRKFLGNERFI